MEQPKEFLVDMLGRVAGVNVIAMASLREDDFLEELGLWNAPQREGASRRLLTMKEFSRRRQRVQ